MYNISMTMENVPSPEFKHGPVEELLDVIQHRFEKAKNITDEIAHDYLAGKSNVLPEGVFLSYEGDSRAGRMSEHIKLAAAEETQVGKEEIISREGTTSTIGAKYHIFRPIIFSHPSYGNEKNPVEGYRPRAFVIYLELPPNKSDACFIADEFGVRPIDFAERDVDLTADTISHAFEELLADDEADVENEIESDQLALSLLSEVSRLPFHPFSKRTA